MGPPAAHTLGLWLQCVHRHADLGGQSIIQDHPGVIRLSAGHLMAFYFEKVFDTAGIAGILSTGSGHLAALF